MSLTNGSRSTLPSSSSRRRLSLFRIVQLFVPFTLPTRHAEQPAMSLTNGSRSTLPSSSSRRRLSLFRIVQLFVPFMPPTCHAERSRSTLKPLVMLSGVEAPCPPNLPVTLLPSPSLGLWQANPADKKKVSTISRRLRLRSG
jgi:hypothetical protein